MFDSKQDEGEVIGDFRGPVKLKKTLKLEGNVQVLNITHTLSMVTI